VFYLPAQFQPFLTFDSNDASGEIDIVIADFAPPLSGLPDGEPLLTLTFEVICEPPLGQSRSAPLLFSTEPSPSFSDPNGQSVVGSGHDGAATIFDADAAPTSTPTVTPTPTATPTSTPTATPTATPPPLPGNRAPQASDDDAQTDEDMQIAVDVLANDDDPDGDSLTVTQLTSPAHGTAHVTNAGTVEYQPETDFHGDDAFSYTVSDGRGGTSTATVRIVVLPVNDPPTIVSAPDTLEVREGENVEERIEADDPDLPADVLRYSAEGLPPGLSLHEFDGIISGTVADGAAGAYTVDVEVTDGQLTDQSRLQWSVLPASPQADFGNLYFPIFRGPAFRGPPFPLRE
jgi:hypothetical protein